ncbi:replication restart helicase PriA [Lachnobacterium bovis]|uniref:Replication restart protein PriA n=1 Tax=Lachnobacterium bovis TaxID=140626 RepID=A0A1H9PCX7_9FIRM|nr:primosomal protein N' [Lachnobacterium bovis]SER46017.1 replication restart DNA helicase PriA [Lachnobacterium bovis]
MSRFANIIVDISHEKLDKTFQYIVPDEFQDILEVGMLVKIPFGPRKIKGYVIELTDVAEYDITKLKPIAEVVKDGISIESRLIALAAWIKKNYGGTFNQALKTVIPVKQKQNHIIKKTLILATDEVYAREQLAIFERKHYTAKARLLKALIEFKEIDQIEATRKLNVSTAVIRNLEENGLLKIQQETTYRNPVKNISNKGYDIILNDMQKQVVDTISPSIDKLEHKTYLLKGVTGSGKTEVYMELIDKVIKSGKQAIVLIPEIALTYQTVMRFYNRFRDLVSVMNSKLSPGERYDQFERAKNGEISIMIGPRSALFTPFNNLGIIIIDEEHESSYKNETIPKYHTREVAIYRAQKENAVVVLGSATPSIDSYYKTKSGEYELVELNQRIAKKPLPTCEIVDLREELKQGNKSILSRKLQQKIEDRLQKKQQIILFINRRGLAGFVSCRACGEVIKCPHCDVSLSQHRNGKLMCHYCGYTIPMPKVCPSCSSKYIAGFRAGTQKIEELVKRRFPQARVLRMDFDTTRKKDSYEQIISSFSKQEADILIGTQMIVKGHDFSNVTLVGVLAADLSLNTSDFRGAERTFQLLTQAAGRAGRGKELGEVIIQTYEPDHYAVNLACQQNYVDFYEKEISYRRLMRYPPIWNMLVIMCSSKNEDIANASSQDITNELHKKIDNPREVQIIGPADAVISKINDTYRKVIYIRTEEYSKLVEFKDYIENYVRDNKDFSRTIVQFDFNPISGF